MTLSANHGVPMTPPPMPDASPAPLKAALTVVTLPSPLDLAGCEPLRQRATELSRTCNCLIVDLQQSQFADSSGVRALLDVAEAMEARGGEVRLVVRPGSRVERTFRLLWLMDRLQVFPTLADACASASPLQV
jgi:anti-anti-sigma factor